jgi:hypothetical protein
MSIRNSLRRTREFVLETRFQSIARIPKLTGEPIIIGGCGRSGTTLLLSILSSHPRIAAARHETRAFTYGVKEGDFSGPIRMGRLHRGLAQSAIPEDALRWCEKTPSNILVLPKIFEHFEERVKVIHIVRDGRDVVTSVHPKRAGTYHVSPQRWVQDVSAGLEFVSRPNVYTLRYEDLILKYGETMQEICTFIGEDHELLGTFPEDATVQTNRAWAEPVAPLSSKSIGRWRAPKFEAQVQKLIEMPAAIELMERFDYL